MNKSLFKTEFEDIQLLKRGKVRDVYDLGDQILMVATDRISAFDVVMPDTIPQKGRILNQISLFWFKAVESICPNHVITSNVEEYPEVCKPYGDILEGRSMLVKKTDPLPIECVVRGYITGSGWKSYQESGKVCGIQLREGLKESEKLPEPIFTPSTKEELGLHDINISFDEAVEKVGIAIAERVKALSISIYKKGAEIADEKGIIIADTKFEFGIVNNELILIDEVLTPDSSRFWPKSEYKPGVSQKSFDKQYLRDYLVSINWNKKPPAPSLPEKVIIGTRDKYLEAAKRLTGKNVL
jgi:phosphoribosylaminoimidazole-succinocarboxamide synthase